MMLKCYYNFFSSCNKLLMNDGYKLNKYISMFENRLDIEVINYFSKYLLIQVDTNSYL